MGDIKREERSGKLIRVSEEEKRTVYTFLEGNEERKYSAFEPNLPKLAKGGKYKYTVEHVPMREEGKFYHNLARKFKDGPYMVEAVNGGKAEESPEPATPDETGNPRPHTPDEYKDPREEYWKNREKNDAIREWAQRRGGYSHDAAAIVAPRVAEYKTVKDAVKAAIEATQEFVKAAEEEEKKFRKTLEYGDLKPQTKDGPEAYVG